MPLFRRSQDEASPAPIEVDPLAAGIEHFSELTPPQRAAELLENIAPKIDDYLAGNTRPTMPMLLEPWLGPRQQKNLQRWDSLQRLLQEAFQILVLARLVIRGEGDFTGSGTKVWYANSPDGRTALDRRDVADVIARRLPD